MGAIEIVAFECGLHHGGVGVTGDADEARHFLLAEFEDLFEDAAFGFDFGEIVFGGEGVNVEEIDAIDLQGFQALLEGARGFGSIARADFGGEEDAVAPPFEHLADALFGEVALAILVGGIDVGDAGIERAGQGFERRSSSLYMRKRLPVPKASMETRAPVLPRTRVGSGVLPGSAASVPRRFR